MFSGGNRKAIHVQATNAFHSVVKLAALPFAYPTPPNSDDQWA
jgi:hypothetical protein